MHILPNGWSPRPYQLNAWKALESGARLVELIWHRRSGKDELAGHWTACSMLEREGDYWHLLPAYEQARKAIWDAVNPHTGKRRIYEWFPTELFTHRSTDMTVQSRYNSSNWRMVGSDNPDSLVGAPPVQVVFSEWAISRMFARAYLRPIIHENNGREIYITTPRGKNHAYRSYESARERMLAGDRSVFAELLTVNDTGAMTPKQIELELAEYRKNFGAVIGQALFDQEFLCSFDAAILGAIWAEELRLAKEDGRLDIKGLALGQGTTQVVLDLGRNDATAIWFFRVAGKDVHVIDYAEDNFKTIEHYNDLIRSRVYNYGQSPTMWLPHDAFAKTLASPRSVEMQFRSLGWTVRRVPSLSIIDGEAAARQLIMNNAYFDERASEGVENLKMYRRDYQEKYGVFKSVPVEGPEIHCADAFRYLSVAFREQTDRQLAESRIKNAKPETIVRGSDLLRRAQNARRMAGNR